MKNLRGTKEMDSIFQNAFEKTMSAEADDQPTQEVGEAQQQNNNDMEVETNFDESEFDAYKASILVVGAGGAGNNTIDRLEEMGIDGASTVAVNTDAKHLKAVKARKKLLVGKELTRGLGAGGYPNVGEQAAIESKKELKEAIEGSDLVFVTLGLGGGTGTGTAPVIAKIAKEAGAIVIGTATMPFRIEGARIAKAEDGLYKLRQNCDTVIVIENDKLLQFAGNLPLKQAFLVADELIASMIKGITECISEPSLVNLDFADVKTIMSQGGVAMVGVGESDSSDRASEAVQKALNNPLLDVDYSGSRGALVHITCGEDVTLDEINNCGAVVAQNLDPDAPCIWGARIEPDFGNKFRVITIITGVKSPYVLGKANSMKEGKPLDNQLGIDMVK